MSFPLPDITPPVVDSMWFSTKKSTEIENEIDILEKEKLNRVKIK